MGTVPRLELQASTKAWGPLQKLKGPQNLWKRDHLARAWGAPLALRLTQEKTQEGWATKQYLTLEMQLYTLQGMTTSRLFTASIHCLESLSNCIATKPKSSVSWETQRIAYASAWRGIIVLTFLEMAKTIVLL